jgi:Icc-related predicted phosphoesterase
MRLLCVTDLHGEQRSLRCVLDDAGPADAVLLGGDLTHFGTPNQAEALVAVTQAHCPVVWAVAGNCDSAAIDERLAQLGVGLFGRGVVYEGVGFCGLSAMPPWQRHMYELTEEELRQALDAGNAQAARGKYQVVLSHAPPRDCRLDRTRSGEHVGSSALREFITHRQPSLVVCGHIHEARGIEQLGATTVVNCGTGFQGHYALVELTDTVHAELRIAGKPAAR